MSNHLKGWPGIIEHYRDYLSVSDKTPIVTLQEGNTPLIPADKLRRELGIEPRIFLKYDGTNPTGSFKDRGMTMAVSKAAEQGATAVICASTGNTSASAAAYSRRAGMKCFVLVPEGNVALGKLAQALVHGAEVVQIRGDFDAALKLVLEIVEQHPVVLVNSLNPFRIEGQMSGAFEIVDSLGHAPYYQCMPVGNAGNITAYWQGYNRYKQQGKCESLPKMLGFQAAGAAPLVRGEVVKHPETIATAIKIGNPASWETAVAARDESGGIIDMVSDAEIITAYKLLASLEGVFVEPASAASLAGLIKLQQAGYFKPEDKEREVVLILTGHGLKDPERAVEEVKPPKAVAAELGAVLEKMKLE
jgi:threonine synthase